MLIFYVVFDTVFKVSNAFLVKKRLELLATAPAVARGYVFSIHSHFLF
jgi:hypothetical protein